MASTTSNLGLTKPAGTDKALVSVINTNSDILDRSAGGLMDAIAIVANGNTHAAISAGQYVYVHNHGTLAEGLYTASSAIAANATLSTSNLTADASGGLNALNSNLGDLHNSTAISNVNLNDYKTTKTYRIGNLGNITNAPSGIGTSGVFLVDAYGAYITQKLYMNAGNAVRLSFDGGTTWNDWDVTALTSDMPAQLGVPNLLSSESTFTISDISGYNMLMITYYQSNSGTIGQLIIPVSTFKTGVAQTIYPNNPSSSENAYIQYVSNTSIKARCTTQGSKYLVIYGIK